MGARGRGGCATSVSGVRSRLVFFFQAEDGIRGLYVTGVQTCALPISSALASKATGFPIAKIAAKLAVGYRLDEINNDITRKTPACFEPTIDYVVAKIPKWAFEKFPGADTTLGTQMKSVGEVMAIGRTFKEALWKGMRSLETGKAFGSEKYDAALIPQKLITPTPDRLNYIRFAMAQGYTVAQIQELTSIDPWFLEQMKEVVDFEGELATAP